jgi:phosphatidate cytidylyltransferase
VVSSVVGVTILGFIMWVGLPLVIPALVFLLWLGSAELRDMLAKRGIELNMAFLRWGGLLMLVFSYPPLSSQYPGIPWREIALGLVLIGAFSYELLNGANIPRFAYSLMAFLYLPWMLGYFLLLRYHPHDDTLGIWTLTLPLLATFATDVGAYFIGRFFGRNKLAPTISPGKTVEGSIGGIVSSFVVLLIYTSIVRHFYPESAFALLQPLELFVFSLLLSLAAQLGDLTESMLKRYCGVKDSGSFLPGHGGLLDRMDSVLFSVPLAYYLLVIFYPI